MRDEKSTVSRRDHAYGTRLPPFVREGLLRSGDLKRQPPANVEALLAQTWSAGGVPVALALLNTGERQKK